VEEVRIFTDKSISPSPFPRQYADRYTFRAGRNLPDKEFRYLRTVIVTAAVHRGFNRELRHVNSKTRLRQEVASLLRDTYIPLCHDSSKKH